LFSVQVFSLVMRVPVLVYKDSYRIPSFPCQDERKYYPLSVTPYTVLLLRRNSLLPEWRRWVREQRETSDRRTTGSSPSFRRCDQWKKPNWKEKKNYFTIMYFNLICVKWVQKLFKKKEVLNSSTKFDICIIFNKLGTGSGKIRFVVVSTTNTTNRFSR
jgi:hypothetical protein